VATQRVQVWSRAFDNRMEAIKHGWQSLWRTTIHTSHRSGANVVEKCYGREERRGSAWWQGALKYAM